MYEALGAIYLERDVPDRVDGVLYRKEGTWGSPDPQGARPGEWDALPRVHRLKLSTEEKKLHYRLFRSVYLLFASYIMAGVEKENPSRFDCYLQVNQV